VRAIWSALLITALGFGEARAQAGSTNFEGWSAVCDDVGECSAWASAGGWASPSYILLRRSADGQWSAQLGAATGTSESAPIEMKVVGPGGKLTWMRRLSASPGDRTRRITLSAADQVAALRDATGKGLTLETSDNGKVEPFRTISLKGGAAALLWIGDRGPDPRRPAIRRAPFVSQAHLPKAPPPEGALCNEPSLARLSPGKILVETSCRVFEDKSESFSGMALLDERGSRMPGPEIEGYDEDDDYGLADAIYDPKTRTLSAFQKGEYHLGSCGANTEWVWGGTRFRMVRQTRMVDCVGIPRDLWPSNRRVRVVDVPGKGGRP
jgi:hypothetical protein